MLNVSTMVTMQKSPRLRDSGKGLELSASSKEFARGGGQTGKDVMQPHVVHSVRSFTSGSCSAYQWRKAGEGGGGVRCWQLACWSVCYSASPFFPNFRWKDGEF